MHRIALLAIVFATATPVLAGPADPAYRYSGTHAGGPADDLISPTGGRAKPTRKAHRNPGYRYSGTHAGGPADAFIGNGRPAPIRHPIRPIAIRELMRAVPPTT